MGKDTTAKRDRPRAATEARQQSILLAAKEVFYEHGYQLSTMDGIAERAATTKRTVYDHFGSKKALFSAVIEVACDKVARALDTAGQLPEDPLDGLRALDQRIRQLINTPGCIQLHRMVIAESERHPEFARQLYDTALAKAERVLTDYLDGRVAAGLLQKHDCALSARLLLNATVHAWTLRELLRVGQRDHERQLWRAGTDHAFAMFVQAYRVARP